MQDTDYSKIGLMAGIEIHQQLDTNKLFCNCPSTIRDDAPDKTVKRILRASAGEIGDVDVAAKSEMEKGKHFIYEYYEDTNCLVELDCEPPLGINKEALGIVLKVSKMVCAEIVDEVHVMRKTVVDGSNTSGFQRTALIARNGQINVDSEDKNIPIKIDTLCLEEDAARIIKKENDHDTYRLDRLGIPLIEIATGPDMRSPQQVKDAAAFIGMLLRSTGRVMRGLGTIRQDVNISIKGGTRVEIKGVQDLRLIDKVVEFEVKRQQRMIRLREEMIERKISVSKDIPKDFSEIFKDTGSKFIRKGLDEGLGIYGKPYKNFKGFFGFEINPNRRFGTELSDRIKLLGLNGLIHTDEDLSRYNISEEIRKIYAESGLGLEDGMIFIVGRYEKCLDAFKRIDDAINSLLTSGLPKEVRNAKDDATSTFLRPMPTSSRMYPETDVPSIIPDTKDIALPELITEKVARFEKEYNIPRQVAKEIVQDENFEYFVRKYPQVKPIMIAEVIDSIPKEIKTRYSLDASPSKGQLEEIFLKLNSQELAKEAVFEILVEIAKGEQGARLDFSKYSSSEDELAGHIVQLISDRPQLNVSGLMGEVMKKYRGKYPGSKIMELIKRFKGE